MIKYIPLLASMFFVLQLIAQERGSGFTPDLSVRYRFERWNGMNARNYGDVSEGAIGDLDDSILFQRIIVGFVWEPFRDVTLSLHMQDSRAFGWSLSESRYPELFRISDKGTDGPYYTMNPNEAFFEIHDAYVAYGHSSGPFVMTLGRQKINYGDNRIFGPGEWGNTGRWTWDAIRASYRFDNHFLDIFAGGTKTHDPSRLSIPFTDTEFWGGGMYAHFDVPSFLHVEPFYAHKRQGSAPYIRELSINRHWLGMRLFNNYQSGMIVDATFAGQFGHEGGTKIQAYGVFAKLGYRFDMIWAKPVVSIKETFATGNRSDGDLISQFEPAFGASDRYYGRMNIVRWSNIDNREIMLELQPYKALRVELNMNWFFIPEPDGVQYLGTLRLNEGAHHLGNELNVFVQYQASRQWQLTGAFGRFIPGSVMAIDGNKAKPASWFAVQALFTICWDSP